MASLFDPPKNLSAYRARVVRGLRLFGVKNPNELASRHEALIESAFKQDISSIAVSRRIARKG